MRVLTFARILVAGSADRICAASRERIIGSADIVHKNKTDLKPDFLVCVQKTALLV